MPTSSRPVTILVVDGEPAVRRFVRRVLEGAGYSVLEAGSGEEAVLAAAAHPGPIEVLLVDLSLPLAPGHDVAARMSASRPGIRVLYMSAGPQQDATDMAEARSVLKKPFPIRELLARVSGALGDTPRDSH
ncbi:MAG: response regulator [Planctomycetes bacterium]|nr:response regulator [Planctomycetota bacterium]